MKKENLLLEGEGSEGPPPAWRRYLPTRPVAQQPAREPKYEVTNPHWDQGSGLDNSTKLCTLVF